MRADVPGMTGLDNTILEFFQTVSDCFDSDIELSAAPVWRNLADVLEKTGRTQDTVARRMRKLAAGGLLERTHDAGGYYRITDRGRRYLTGDLSADEITNLREGLSTTD